MASHPPLKVTRRGFRLLGAAVLVVLGASAWAVVTWVPMPGGSADPASQSPPPVRARLVAATPSDATQTVEDDPDRALVAATRALLTQATTVVVADPGVGPQARRIAADLNVPAFPTTVPDLRGLLDDLGAQVVVRVQTAAATSSPSAAAPTSVPSAASPSEVDLGDREVRVVPVAGPQADRSGIADLRPAVPLTPPSALVLVPDDDDIRKWLPTVTAAAGAQVVALPKPLTETPAAVKALQGAPDRTVVAVGTSAGWKGRDLNVLAWDAAVVRRGTEIPGGGFRMFPGRRIVALYGSPNAASLGVLGEQPVKPAIARARKRAKPYAELVDEPVIPAFEIISTVATGSAGKAGDYSRRVPHDLLRTWIDAAEDAGMYVILDLQSGRTDFLTQAKELKDLLVRPHVGLALDPEWRLRDDQVPLEQVGSVAVEEVQSVIDWLADLTRTNALPQKLLVLHQFRLSMLPDREQLQLPAELAVTIQMDGQGAQPVKLSTWGRVTTSPAPKGVWFGWKNFYDEDTTLRSPEDTYGVDPSPKVVSYQ